MHDFSLICLGMLLGWFLAIVVIVVVAAPMRSSQISHRKRPEKPSVSRGRRS
jgi:hypothetical protein